MTAEEFVAWLKGYFEIAETSTVDERNRKYANRVELWGPERIASIKSKLYSVAEEVPK